MEKDMSPRAIKGGRHRESAIVRRDCLQKGSSQKTSFSATCHAVTHQKPAGDCAHLNVRIRTLIPFPPSILGAAGPPAVVERPLHGLSAQ